MLLRYQEYGDFFVFSKPFGVRTHKVADGQLGFVEYLSEKLQKELWVVHRLDKETSGLILFAKSKQAAAELSELFEKHEITKTYCFLTDKTAENDSFTIKSHIEKQDQFFVNNSAKPDNSETEFKFVKQLGRFQLWQAKPKTGKPHQIRLHAQKAGIPILGDTEHSGGLYHRLALHAEELEFSYNNEKFNFKSASPSFKSIWHDCFDARHSLYQIPEHESYRLIHNESDFLRADIYKDRLWVYDYSENGLSQTQIDEIKNFADEKKLIPLIRKMLDRGTGVGGLEKSTILAENDTSWTAQEESTLYRLKTDSGFSPGLFLDQRENRKWIKQNSKNKNVLNLFCYTAGFSVCAALGEAAQVTSVDVSKKFLDWGKENFALNRLEPEKYEFFAQDSLLFLKGSVKRARQWDLIICDPPSFGRSKDGVWKLEQNLPELADLLLKCLNKNGQILFTCNLEKKNLKEIIQLFTKKIKSQKYRIKPMPQMSLDYECTDELKNLMKGFILEKP